MGYHTKKPVTVEDLDDVELSCCGGPWNKQVPCPSCASPMRVLVNLHCPTDDAETRRVVVFFCPKEPVFRVHVVAPEAQQPVDTGLEFVDDVDAELLAELASAPAASPKKPAAKTGGKWIGWYDEVVEHADDVAGLQIEEGDDDEEEETVEDRQWFKLLKSMSRNPKQVVRYGGRPLLISDRNAERCGCAERCGKCNGALRFEFEVLSSVIFVMGGNVPEFGALLVFTCPSCCDCEGCVVVLDGVDE